MVQYLMAVAALLTPLAVVAAAWINERHARAAARDRALLFQQGREIHVLVNGRLTATLEQIVQLSEALAEFDPGDRELQRRAAEARLALEQQLQAAPLPRPLPPELRPSD